MKTRFMIGVELQLKKDMDGTKKYYIIDNENEETYEISKKMYYQLKEYERNDFKDIPEDLKNILLEKSLITTDRIFEFEDSNSCFIPLIWISKITKKRRLLCRWLNVLLPIMSVCIFALGRTMLYSWREEFYYSDFDFIFMILLIFFSGLIHEFGHTIASIAIKSKVSCIGLFTWFKFVPAGFAVYTYSNNNASKIARIQEILAGLEMNLLFAGILAIILSTSSYCSIVVYEMYKFNILLIILNLIPVLSFDGEKVLDVIRNKE